MKTPTPTPDYLWDGKGRPDERIAELEALLSRFRRPAPPAAPRPSSASGKRPAAKPAAGPSYEIGWGWYVAAAALLAIFAAGTVVRFFDARRAREWSVVDAKGSSKLARGQSIHTSAGKTARLESPAVGVVELAENTTLTLLDVRDGLASLDLSAGTIHARTTSPPGVFVVSTPRGRAVDMGCEYTLRVEPGRGGRLHVDSGWVELTRVGQQSLVPAAASAVFDAAGRLTPPWFDDAQADFGDAVRRFALPAGIAADAVARMHALDRILTLARRRDGLTLLGLLGSPYVTREERLRIHDRLSSLVPPPRGVARERVGDGAVSALDEWWPLVREAAGVPPLQKKKRTGGAPPIY